MNDSYNDRILTTDGDDNTVTLAGVKVIRGSASFTPYEDEPQVLDAPNPPGPPGPPRGPSTFNNVPSNPMPKIDKAYEIAPDGVYAKPAADNSGYKFEKGPGYEIDPNGTSYSKPTAGNSYDKLKQAMGELDANDNYNFDDDYEKDD